MRGHCGLVQTETRLKRPTYPRRCRAILAPAPSREQEEQQDQGLTIKKLEDWSLITSDKPLTYFEIDNAVRVQTGLNS